MTKSTRELAKGTRAADLKRAEQLAKAGQVAAAREIIRRASDGPTPVIEVVRKRRAP